MSLNQELEELATELVGSGWRTKPEITWSAEERAAHGRWMARMDRIDPGGTGKESARS